MKRNVWILLFALTFGAASFAQAGERPIQLSILEPIQLIESSEDIKGLRLGFFYGLNENVTGIDVNVFVGHTKGDFEGISFALANKVEGSATAIQLGAIGYVMGDFTGLQHNLVSVAKSDVTGLQISGINWTDGSVEGLQLGIMNSAKAGAHGVQLGLLNCTKGALKGLQVGLLNHATEIEKGLQIGLLNMNDAKDPIYISPIVNGKF